MEYFLAVPAGSGSVRKERFDDLGAALERAVELCANDSAPAALTDTGDRRLLGQKELLRLAALVDKFAPVDDRVAGQVFGALPDETLDALLRWLLFRMRAAGTSPRARLAVLGGILDTVSPDE